jgi:hypothetical protein
MSIRTLTLLGCILAAATVSAQAGVITDAFTITGDRSAGDDLAGTNTEVGSATWEVDGTLRFTADGLVENNDAGGTSRNGWGGVPITAPTSGTISVSVDANVYTGGNDWATVSLGPSVGNPTGTDDNLFFLLRGSGQVILWYDAGGVRQQIAQNVQVPDFDDSVMHTMTLIYDIDANQVSASIDGLEIVSPTTPSGAPVLHYAMMGLEDDLDIGQLDNFVYVPEPATLGLLAIAGTAMVRRRR